MLQVVEENIVIFVVFLVTKFKLRGNMSIILRAKCLEDSIVYSIKHSHAGLFKTSLGASLPISYATALLLIVA